MGRKAVQLIYGDLNQLLLLKYCTAFGASSNGLCPCMIGFEDIKKNCWPVNPFLAPVGLLLNYAYDSFPLFSTINNRHEMRYISIGVRGIAVRNAPDLL